MRLNIKVVPNSGRQDFDEESGKVYLKKLPEGGKANLELVKFLKKHFGKNVRIVSGLSSRKKVVEVVDGD